MEPALELVARAGVSPARFCAWLDGVGPERAAALAFDAAAGLEGLTRRLLGEEAALQAGALMAFLAHAHEHYEHSDACRGCCAALRPAHARFRRKMLAMGLAPRAAADAWARRRGARSDLDAAREAVRAAWLAAAAAARRR